MGYNTDMKEDVVEHFLRVDPKIHAFVLKVGPIRLVKSSTYFRDLCDTIISQQLSSKAGATIVSRFFDLFEKRVPTAEIILSLPEEKLRGVGMSRAKVTYVRALAEATLNKTLTLEKIDALSDAEVIAMLTTVKGIGPWTAEMFLMFSLAREDVFSVGDLGLRRGIQRVYNMKKEPTLKKLLSLSKKWAPYRSYASQVLWKSLEL